jgi:hypothetical protein
MLLEGGTLGGDDLFRTLLEGGAAGDDHLFSASGEGAARIVLRGLAAVFANVGEEFTWSESGDNEVIDGWIFKLRVDT